MWICAREHSPDRDQKRLLIPLQLELQVVGSRQTWVLGTEFRSPARAVYTLHHQAISPALRCVQSLTLHDNGRQPDP